VLIEILIRLDWSPEQISCRKKRKKRYGGYEKRGQILNRTSIDERPQIVEDRSRLGDWEADTIIDKGKKGAIVTLVDRKSRCWLFSRFIPLPVIMARNLLVMKTLLRHLRSVSISPTLILHGREGPMKLRMD